MPNHDAPTDIDPLVGATLAGRYRIVNKIGEGGMGAVYVGHQMLGTTTRKVAIKTLHNHLSHDPKILARFERECATVAELQHPNTIQVIDFGKTDSGILFFVMEYVEGANVAAILEAKGPMAPSRVSKILAQVCGSLAEAHGRGIVHRDLKPENIVLCDRAGQKDWVKVLDFGIAKKNSEVDDAESKLTQQGTVVGTPPYMSPEQFKGDPLDGRSDVYSLGVMAYEMLTGALPFHGNTVWEWATAHMTATPSAFESTPAGCSVPKQMRDAVFTALAKSPEDRFASVDAFLEAFRSSDLPLEPLRTVTGPTPAFDAALYETVDVPLDPVLPANRLLDKPWLLAGSVTLLLLGFGAFWVLSAHAPSGPEPASLSTVAGDDDEPDADTRQPSLPSLPPLETAPPSRTSKPKVPQPPSPFTQSSPAKPTKPNEVPVVQPPLSTASSSPSAVPPSPTVSPSTASSSAPPTTSNPTPTPTTSASPAQVPGKEPQECSDARLMKSMGRAKEAAVLEALCTKKGGKP